MFIGSRYTYFTLIVVVSTVRWFSGNVMSYVLCIMYIGTAIYYIIILRSLSWVDIVVGGSLKTHK